jgi:hypothetical protein
MSKENSEHSAAKIQAIQAISVALIGAIATIMGAYIATSNNSPKKEEKPPQTETVAKPKQDASQPPQTPQNPIKTKNSNSQNPDNQSISNINQEVEAGQNDLKDFLKQVREQKNTLKEQVTQAETAKKYKIKDQILRLEEIEEKIAIDINTLQNWLNKPKLSAQEQKELVEISQSLEKLQEELNLE